MIIQDRRSNVPEDINGGKLNFLEHLRQADSAHQFNNNDTPSSDPAVSISMEFYISCSKHAFDSRKFFAPVFQHSNDQEEDNNDTLMRDYRIGVLQPSHTDAGPNQNLISEDPADTSQAGIRIMSNAPQTPHEAPCPSNNSPMFYPPAMYESPRDASTFSIMEPKSVTTAPPGFNSVGSIRGLESEPNCNAADEPSKCIQRHTCKHRDCGKSFTTSAHLSRHVKLHTGQRPHKCPLPGCKKEFARRDNMLVHYRTHAKKSGVESGLTVVSARRTSSGNIPQESDGGDADTLPLRISQANRDENYSLSAPIYQYNDMSRVRGPYDAFCVSRPNPRMSCPYISSPIDKGVVSFKNDAVTQQPVSAPNSLYDERVFDTGVQQIYSKPYNPQVGVSDARDIQTNPKYSRKPVCRQRSTGLGRQRSRSETPVPYGLDRMHPSMMYRPFFSQVPYQHLKDGRMDQEISIRQQEVLISPQCFGASGTQQVQGLLGYYSNEKSRFEHPDDGSTSADPMLPAVINSLITGNNTTIPEAKNQETHCHQRPPKLERFQDHPPLPVASSARAFSYATTDISV